MPIFSPDAGHEDKDRHSESKETWFYGVISKDWRGIVTSQPPPLVVDIASDSTFSCPASRAPSPTKVSRRTLSSTKAGASTSQKLAKFNPTPSLRDTAAIAAKFETWANNKDDQQPLMFAVSGTSRIFRDRYRALAAFLETPGAELFYTYDEDAVLEFIDKEAGRMLKKKT
ncbi:hypothetical protein B0H19DRAFT_1079143 [Mycena capillaripes]|nr:hypothetical protein B0H19DRAFT_1079143 [Mycena capillaripes]